MSTRRFFAFSYAILIIWLVSGTTTSARQAKKDDLEDLDAKAKAETPRLLGQLVPKDSTLREVLPPLSGFSDKDKPATLTLRDAVVLALIHTREGAKAPRITAIDAKTMKICGSVKNLRMFKRFEFNFSRSKEITFRLPTRRRAMWRSSSNFKKRSRRVRGISRRGS